MKEITEASASVGLLLATAVQILNGIQKNTENNIGLDKKVSVLLARQKVMFTALYFSYSNSTVECTDRNARELDATAKWKT